MQPNVDIADALRKGYDLYKENISTLLIATLLAAIISVLSIGILAGPMLAGVTLLTLGLIDRREPKPQIGDIFKGFSFFLPSLVFVILLIVASLAGQFILGLIPVLGFLLSTLFSMALSTVVMFTIFYIVDRKMEVVAAIQQSFDTVKQNFWIFLGLNIVASVVSSLGVIACVIGIIVTLPMYYCTLAVVYRDLHPAASQA
jgi:uncharacterized membrane protein